MSEQTDDQLDRRLHRQQVARHRTALLNAMNAAHRTLGQLIDEIERINPNEPLSSQTSMPWGIEGVLADVANAQARLAALDAIRDMEPAMPAVLPREEA